jgi:hypothetical protein
VRLTRSTMPRFATLCAFALLIGACGGSDSPDSVDAANPTAADNAATDTPDDSDDGSQAADGDTDCAALKADAELVGVAIQIYPQMQTPDTLTDTFVLPDLEALQTAIADLRPFANADTDAFLDDLEAGADIIAAGRAGDADAAVGDLAAITGGLDGLQDWLFRQIALGDSLRATGCPNLG